VWECFLSDNVVEGIKCYDGKCFILALIESIAAYVVLGERFTDPNQYIGLGLIVSGLFFLKIPLE